MWNATPHSCNACIASPHPSWHAVLLWLHWRRNFVLETDILRDRPTIPAQTLQGEIAVVACLPNPPQRRTALEMCRICSVSAAETPPHNVDSNTTCALWCRDRPHPHQPMPRPWELKPNTPRMCQPKARRMSRKHTSSSELESAPAWVRCTGQPRDTNAQVTDTKVTSAMPQVAVGRQTLGTHTHTSAHCRSTSLRAARAEETTLYARPAPKCDSTTHFVFVYKSGRWRGTSQALGLLFAIGRQQRCRPSQFRRAWKRTQYYTAGT